MEAMRSIQEKASRLRIAAALFAPWGDDYRAAYEEAREALDPLAPALPTAAVRRRLERDVLAAGAPASALPVESLYRPWAAAPEGAGGSATRGGAADFGAARHLFLGDSAQHMRELYRRLQLEVPAPFEAMPDHVALLAETVDLFAQAGNAEAVAAMMDDHFGWLGDYRAELAVRREALTARADAGIFQADELACALNHASALADGLVALADDLALSVRAIDGRWDREQIHR